MTWTIIPVIVAFEVTSLGISAFLALAIGPIIRTLYTLWRFGHSLVKSKKNYPVITLIVGTLPVVGNLAYPLELVYRSSRKQDKLAKFIIYSLSARMGSNIPIWGGKDSGIEHFMVKIVSRFI